VGRRYVRRPICWHPPSILSRSNHSTRARCERMCGLEGRYMRRMRHCTARPAGIVRTGKRSPHSLVTMKLTAPRVSFRGTGPTPTIDYSSRPQNTKLASDERTMDSPVQLYEWRTCSICGKRRSRNAQATRAVADLDQHICSRRRCAKLKHSLANACSSGTLTVAVYHYYHPGTASREVRPPAFVAELPGHTSTVGRSELPGSSGRDLSLHHQGRLDAMSREAPSIKKSTKPSARVVADRLRSSSR
jgi:hypothetical protein